MRHPSHHTNLRRLVAVVAAAALSLNVHVGLLARSGAGAPGPADQALAAPQTVNVTVMRSGSPQAGTQLRLRSVITGQVMAQGFSAANGALAFSAVAPGLYFVEALSPQGGVEAISGSLEVRNAPVAASLSLREQTTTQKKGGAVGFFTSAAFIIVAAALTTGLLVYAATKDEASPEQ